MGDFLDEKRREIAQRLDELRPLVDEYQRLDAAVSALSSVPVATAPAATRSRKPAGGSASEPRTAAGARRRGRPKGSGTRARQALELVNANPGITIAQMAETLGIKQNYLYRVLASLAEDGHVTKDARGWFPKPA